MRSCLCRCWVLIDKKLRGKTVTIVSLHTELAVWRRIAGESSPFLCWKNIFTVLPRTFFLCCFSSQAYKCIHIGHIFRPVSLPNSAIFMITFHKLNVSKKTTAFFWVSHHSREFLYWKLSVFFSILQTFI